MEARLTEILQEKFQTGLEQATNEQVYYALLTLTKERIKEGPKNEGKRKLYYISAEFLIGKLLSNNLINLGIYDETAEVLKKHGKNLAEIEEVEPEPSLGNGGLGRLAACFLDSIATLGLPGDGIGLNYHMGLFKQVFTDHKQDEQKNPWIEKDSWLNDTGISFEVPFKDFSLRSHLYDIDVTGYEGGSNKLHLFDVETVNDAIVGNGINFDKNDIRENLTLFLYPDDSDKAGNLLRIYQQYFMVSNAAQYIIRECEEKGYDLLVEVAKKVLPSHPEWEWHLYGTGDTFDEIHQKVVEYNLTSQLIQKGNVKDVYKLYNEYAFLVLPSYREGLPLVLLEAKASGLPMVSFDVTTGPREIVEEGKDGYLIPPYDLDKMANRIELLTDSEERRIAFSNHTISGVKKFEKEEIYRQWTNLIDELTMERK